LGVLIAALIANSEALARVSRELARLGLEPPPRYHVTILFLGDLSGAFLRRAIDVFDGIDVEVPRYARVTGYSFLPPSSPRNVALTLDPRELEPARKTLEKSMPVAKKDRYSFLPHVTIARKPRSMSPEEIEEARCILENMRRARQLPREVRLEGLALVKSSAGEFIVLSVK